MKKSSLIIGSFMGLVIMTSSVMAATTNMSGFSDVPDSHWGKDAVKWSKEAMLVEGYKDGTFLPNNPISRVEMVQVLSKYHKMMEGKMMVMADKMAAMEKKMTDMEVKMAAMEKEMDMDMPMASVMYMATLNGAAEVPAVDTTATGTATFELKDGKLWYTIEVKDLSGAITGAHIHMGEAGKAGDVVTAITFDGMKAVGSWTPTAQQIKDLDAKMLYVNVHTDKNKDGEVRGQIMPKA